MIHPVIAFIYISVDLVTNWYKISSTPGIQSRRGSTSESQHLFPTAASPAPRFLLSLPHVRLQPEVSCTAEELDKVTSRLQSFADGHTEIQVSGLQTVQPFLRVSFQEGEFTVLPLKTFHLDI